MPTTSCPGTKRSAGSVVHTAWWIELDTLRIFVLFFWQQRFIMQNTNKDAELEDLDVRSITINQSVSIKSFFNHTFEYHFFVFFCFDILVYCLYLFIVIKNFNEFSLNKNFKDQCFGTILIIVSQWSWFSAHDCESICIQQTGATGTVKLVCHPYLCFSVSLFLGKICKTSSN